MKPYAYPFYHHKSHPWDWDDWDPPVEILREVPSLLGSIGRRLKNLDINIALPSRKCDLGSIRPTTGDESHIEHAVSNLQEIRFKIRLLSDILVASTPDQLENLAKLARPMFSCSTLKSIAIYTKGLRYPCEPPYKWHIGSFLEPKPEQWPQLKEMTLDFVHMTPSALDGLLGAAPPLEVLKMHMPRIVEGTWAQAVDVLRSRIRKETSSELQFRAPQGAEVSSFKEAGLRMDPDLSFELLEAPACDYILISTDKNPFKFM